jgi:hypothetical protein
MKTIARYNSTHVPGLEAAIERIEVRRKIRRDQQRVYREMDNPQSADRAEVMLQELGVLHGELVDMLSLAKWPEEKR